MRNILLSLMFAVVLSGCETYYGTTSGMQKDFQNVSDKIGEIREENRGFIFRSNQKNKTTEGEVK